MGGVKASQSVAAARICYNVRNPRATTKSDPTPKAVIAVAPDEADCEVVEAVAAADELACVGETP